MPSRYFYSNVVSVDGGFTLRVSFSRIFKRESNFNRDRKPVDETIDRTLFLRFLKIPESE